MTFDEAVEYMDHAEQSESEMRGEWGMGAVSMGYDPHAWVYDGYTTATDPLYRVAKKIVDAEMQRRHPAPVATHDFGTPGDPDDIPF